MLPGPTKLKANRSGTVCMAVSLLVGEGDDRDRYTKTSTIGLPGDRERIRQFSTITVLDMLRRLLLLFRPALVPRFGSLQSLRYVARSVRAAPSLRSVAADRLLL